MRFCDELNHYLEQMNCTSKELSEASGLSSTILSRYLNDKRTPRIQSEYFEQLVNGLYNVAIQKNYSVSKEEIFDTFAKSITYGEIDFDDFVYHFNILLIELKINISDIAKAVGYDTSFISKMKNKTRKPSNLNEFIDKLGDYVVTSYQSPEKKEMTASLFRCSVNDLWNNEEYKKIFMKWITLPQANHQEIVQNFLEKLDSFNLNDYIGTDFSKVKVPSSPIILKTSKTFYGANGRKQAESEFLKTTLLSKIKEPIFFYSNLPIAEAAEDDNFKQKWVVAMTMLLKKGLPLNIVHNVDRPIHEMLLGLEAWIPIYMIGSISPYYFITPPSNFFSESFCSSGSVTLVGECIKDNLKYSKFYLTTKKEEQEYYHEKSKYLLSKAKPLMTIYKEENRQELEEFMEKEENKDYIRVEKENFKNIDFYIHSNQWVIIHKKNAPEIHFVIHHEKLIHAIKTFFMA